MTARIFRSVVFVGLLLIFHGAQADRGMLQNNKSKTAGRQAIAEAELPKKRPQPRALTPTDFKLPESTPVAVVETPARTTREKNRNKRIASRRSQPSEKKVLMSEMNDEQLDAMIAKCEAEKDLSRQIHYVEYRHRTCEDIATKAALTIKLADLYFQTGELLLAEKLYTEFVHLYPGNTKIEYAMYKRILCSFYRILDAYHDQTRTQETIALVDQFIERGTIFKEYYTEVADIHAKCCNRLVDYECNIANFYIDYGNFKSAQNRIDNLRVEWLDKMPALELRLVELEDKLVNAQQAILPKPAPMAKKSSDSATPASPDIVVAENSTKKKFSERF
jgi:outer membrane assembly lipoprotein YfiO